MSDDILVTGLGMLTPLGRDPVQLWQRLLNGESAAREWPDLIEQDFRHTTACRIDRVPEYTGSRGRDLAIAAATDAIRHAGIRKPPARTGLYLGSTMGESAAFERAAETGRDIDRLTRETCAAFTQATADALGMSGPRRAYGTACAAGNYAIGAAAEQLRRGKIDVALAGGVEPFSRIAMTGFSRSRAMSEGVCRPFDQQRDGMLLGEGAAVLVLERKSDARARGARPLATVGALGLSGDAYHATAPRTDGGGAAAAYHAALMRQGLAPADIRWVCAHGTGTRLSDAAEAEALGRVFGADMPDISGLKGAIGHAMGAATAIEAAISVLAIARQQLPPTTGLQTPAFDLPFVRAPAPTTMQWVANAGFAFGGLNSVLLLGAA